MKSSPSPDPRFTDSVAHASMARRSSDATSFASARAAAAWPDRRRGCGVPWGPRAGCTALPRRLLRAGCRPSLPRPGKSNTCRLSSTRAGSGSRGFVGTTSERAGEGGETGGSLVAAAGGVVPLPEPGQRFARERCADLKIHQIDDRRWKIAKTHCLSDGSAATGVWRRRGDDQQWDVDLGLIEARAVAKDVRLFTETLAVVGGDDQPGPFEDPTVRLRPSISRPSCSSRSAMQSSYESRTNAIS